MAILCTADCSREAEAVRVYCESLFPVGPPSSRMHSATGERFTQLTISWSDGFGTLDEASAGAKAAFKGYAEGKSGTLYWRVVPEIAKDQNRRKFAYYMRLLISDKPRKA